MNAYVDVGLSMAEASETESVVSDVLYQGRVGNSDNFTFQPPGSKNFSADYADSQADTASILMQSRPGSDRDDFDLPLDNADDLDSEENLPEYACSYCGIHNPSCVVKCVTCNKWFCNSKGTDHGASHIVNHLVRSKHKLVALHPDSPLGDVNLECYHCGNKNVFVLGFVSAKAESVVVILCRHPCAKNSSESTNWDPAEWQPLIEDRSFLSWVVSNPSEREQLRARHISSREMNQLEDLWRTNEEATLKDLLTKTNDTLDLKPIALRYQDGYEYQRTAAPIIRLEADTEKTLIGAQAQENVTITWEIGLRNQYLASFKLAIAEDLSDFNISVGGTMTLTHDDGTGSPWEGEGIITKTSGNSWDNITLEIRPKGDAPPIDRTSNWSVKSVWHAATYERMYYALKKFATEDTSVSSYIYHKLMGHDVDELFLNVKLPKKMSVPGMVSLNPSQLNAVEKVLKKPLSLIQGPPGTGKTVVSTTIVYHLYKLYKEPVLVCAPSNVAVDQLAERISKTGLRVVRMTSKARESVSSPVEKLTVRNQVLSDLNRKKSNRLSKLMKLKEVLGELDKSDQKEYRKLLDKAEQAILSRSEVICCTCATAGDWRIHNKRFRAALIDESTQATEAQCLIPIVHGCKQVILVGDHMQLGPVVRSRDAERLGLSQSLFERLVILKMAPIRLDIQYRMHPALSAFPSNMFYDGGLQNGVTAAQRTTDVTEQFPFPDKGKPMLFWSSMGLEELSASGTSFLNRTEAANVEKIVTRLFKNGVKPSQIGIVTPYKGQRAYISQYMTSNSSFDEEMYQQIEIESVDAFQGREKDYIVLSCVRSNQSQGIGFLGDARRLNVAITRARYGLIILGNPRVLSRDVLWSHLLAYFKEHKCLMEGPLSSLKECKIPLSKPKRPYRANQRRENQGMKEKLSLLDGTLYGQYNGQLQDIPHYNGDGGDDMDDTASIDTEIAFTGRHSAPQWEEINRMKEEMSHSHAANGREIGNSVMDRIDRLNRKLDENELLGEYEGESDITKMIKAFASKAAL